ncbi:hypothetical protein IDH44_15650 [Paenibacillus sp. IB182496]|uniref:Uncharacterized protein n=1 Tax=Paenibacillus sabuli TaxID=2772509 RepID=A0A927BW78_9BACL|nr:hypothetical protein [Paenibacillus sabuli]MBD2846634.1 hypothetical protein [Paenibacillus sabuli]
MRTRRWPRNPRRTKRVGAAWQQRADQSEADWRDGTSARLPGARWTETCSSVTVISGA